MSQAIPFVKAHACGNDFILIEAEHTPTNLADFTRRICSRTTGVGADGVEFLSPADDADIYARLINADGSEAEISGNGTRCVAAYLASKSSKQVVRVRTGAGVKTCTLISSGENTYEFETEMGEPQTGDLFSIRLSFGEVAGVPVSMGNPHFVVFVDEFEPGWQAEAAEIGHHHDFQHGMNVEFVRVAQPDEIHVRFFERGVGETMSSGTGSSAAAVAAISTGRAVSPVKVVAPGGTQVVRYEQRVSLTGPAQLICRGEFFV